MKGINCCGDCVYYSTKKHKCTRGASLETDPKDPFYDDCPLPEVALVVHGRWERRGGVFECSHCREYGGSHAGLYNFCPNCGARMYGKEDG